MPKAVKYADNVDTDVIIPARYLNTSSIEELAAHCMEGIDPGFAGKVERGDIIAAGSNFGCGSSREHAPAVIKECGISAVVARTFARIFYRNAINIGLPIFECEHDIENGDDVSVDFDRGVVINNTKNKTYQAEPFPKFIKDIIASGGLLAALKAEDEGI